MVTPRCPYFGKCGGCSYQHLEYEAELRLKETSLKELFQKELGLPDEVFFPITPSPEPYFYRSRLDLSFHRVRGETVLGFMGEGSRGLVPIDSCTIARPEINDFLPQLKELARERLTAINYKSANLVVRTDQEGKVRWGGIGAKSLELPEADYFWIEIEGKRIFYSLDTFFQANLGILPEFIQNLRAFLDFTPETHFFDLYAGVGLFWTVFSGEVGEVWAIEESESAVRVAEFNRRYHNFSQVFLKQGKIEDSLDEILLNLKGGRLAAVIDPPRKGLTPVALEKLSAAKTLSPLVYISCHPPDLIRDLKGFLKAGWRIDRVAPFDFFPRTRHLEVMTRMFYDSPL